MKKFILECKKVLVENSDNDLLYHGSVEKISGELNKSINWITKDYAYAKTFTFNNGYIYTCKASLNNLFNVGKTDARVYDLLPIKPYKLSKEFKSIVGSLNIDDNTLKKLLSDIIHEYNLDADGYKLTIRLVVRSDAFRKIIQNLGYSGIKAIEYDSINKKDVKTYGIFNSVKIISTEVVNESLNEYFDSIDDSGEEHSGYETLQDCPLFMTDEVYKIKSMLEKQDLPYRILKLDNCYLIQDARGNKTHGDMYWKAYNDGYIESEAWDRDAYMVFIPNGFKGELRWHTRLGEDGYYDCRVYDFGVVFVRDRNAYNNDLFTALGKHLREISYSSWDDEVTVNDGKSSKTLEIDSDLKGDPNNAITIDLDSVQGLFPELLEISVQKNLNLTSDNFNSLSDGEKYKLIKSYIEKRYNVEPLDFDYGIDNSTIVVKDIKWPSKNENLQEKIVKKGNKWQVQSEDGTKNLGTYDTKKEAEKRLQQVHYFKHMNEGREDFFKNSVVRDSQGNLLPVYHCSFSDFDVFSIDDEDGTIDTNDWHGQYGFAWFAEDLDYARNYGDDSFEYECYLNITKPLDIGEIDNEVLASEEDGTKIKDDYDESGFSYVSDEYLQLCELVKVNPEEMIKYFHKWWETGCIYDITRRAFFKNLVVKLGYDGVTATEGGAKTWGCVRSNQIKLVSNENPTDSISMKEDINKKFGYRHEFDDGHEIDLRNVIEFETAELYNVDILETILNNFEVDNKELVQEVIDNIEDIDEDKIQEAIDECIKAIHKKYPDAKYCLWLCDSEEDVYNSYIEPFEHNDEDIDYSKYQIEYDTPISDLGTEGSLYVYSKIPQPIDEALKESADEDFYYRGYDSRYGVFDSPSEYSKLYTWVTDSPEYALEYAENNKYGKVAKVRITCSDDEIGGVLDLPEDVDYYDPGDDMFKEFILDNGLKGYGFTAGEYDDFCMCISKDCVEVIDPDVKVEVEEESLKEAKNKYPDWSSMEEVNNTFWKQPNTKLKDVLDIWYGYEGNLKWYELYHGTTESSWKKILKDKVIKPGQKKNYGASKSGCVYLTTSEDDAYEYVYRGTDGNENAVVMSINLSKLDLDKLYIDTNETYAVMKDEETGKEYWDFFDFEYYGEIPSSAWIKTDIDESLNESKQDIEKFKQWAGEDIANRFFAIKDRLQGQEKDIYYWMGLEKKYGKHGAIQEINSMLRDIENTPTKKERNQLAQEGADLLYNAGGWKVYEISTYEASKKYGKGTNWCISGDDMGYDYFSDYHDSGDKIYFYIHGDDKYALIMRGDRYTIYNDFDDRVAYVPNAPKVQGLPDISDFNPHIVNKVTKLYNIKPEDIKDIKDMLYDSDTADFFFDMDTREAYGIITDNGTYYCYYYEPDDDYVDVTDEFNEWADEYLDEPANEDYTPIAEDKQEDNSIEELDDSYYFYRGYDCRYDSLDNLNLYTWVTDDFEYAKEYADELGKYGKIAKLEIYCEPKDIGTVESLPSDIDYLDPGDDNFKKYIIDKGLLGYQFNITNNYNGNNSWCLCIHKDCCKVVCNDVKESIKSMNEDLQETDNEGNVLSKEQIEFFKNSKIRDNEGRLLVCYHGSDADRFNVFDHNFIGDDNKSGYGFYFTQGTKLQFKHNSTYACYINIEKPLTNMETIGRYVRNGELLRERGKNQKEIIDILAKKYNCDGIINPDRGVVAFYSNQIKSIDNKNPTNSDNINESADEDLNILDALDKEFGQEELYMWSTYILPNGHFLNPDNAQDYWDEIEEYPVYEHCDFEDWAYEHGYSNIQDIYNNCVKMNVTYPYLSMPDKAKPTQEQLSAVRKILDRKDLFEPEGTFYWYDIFPEEKVDSKGENLLAVYTPFGDELFDLDVSSANDIIRAINQAYVRGGFFNESLNEDYTPTAEDFPFTLEDIEKAYPNLISDKYEQCGNAFIMPNGKFILSGKEFNIHSDFAADVLLEFNKDKDIDILDEWDYDYSKILDAFTKYFKLIRVNDGLTYYEDRVYFVIKNDSASTQQWESLKQYLDFVNSKRNKNMISAYVTTRDIYHSWVVGTNPDEIVQDCKNAMRMGYFIEKLDESIKLVDEDNENVYYTYLAKEFKDWIESKLYRSATSVIRFVYYPKAGLYVFCDGYNGIHEMLEEMAQKSGLVNDSYKDYPERYLIYAYDESEQDVLDYSDGTIYDYKDFRVFEPIGEGIFTNTTLFQILGHEDARYTWRDYELIVDESIKESLEKVGDTGIYFSSSLYEIKDKILNSKKPLKLVGAYVDGEEVWLIGNPYGDTHADMRNYAQDYGYLSGKYNRADNIYLNVIPYDKKINIFVDYSTGKEYDYDTTRIVDITKEWSRQNTNSFENTKLFKVLGEPKESKEYRYQDHINEEVLHGEDTYTRYSFDCWATKSPYEVKNILLNSKDAMRVFIDEEQSLYLVGRAYECTHTDMIKLAKANSIDTSIDDYDNKKVCIVYSPKNEYNIIDDFDVEDASDDDYTYYYEYNDFVIFSRYQDFDTFELSDILGSHKSGSI